jgi:hypothetical protein
MASVLDIWAAPALSSSWAQQWSISLAPQPCNRRKGRMPGMEARFKGRKDNKRAWVGPEGLGWASA